MKLNEDTPFLIGETNLDFAKESPFKLEGGLILLCLNGEAEIMLDMISYTLKQSNVAIIFTKSSLICKSTSDNFKSNFLYCTSEIIHDACNRFNSSFYNQIDFNPICLISKQSEKTTINYLKLLQMIIDDKHNRYRRVIVSNLMRCLLLNIYDNLQRVKETDNEIIQTRKDELMGQFMDKVRAHCIHHHDVQYYANSLCISSRYLNSITKKISKLSPKELIDNQIISEIKTMLQFSDLSLSQIAENFRFPDQSYLSRFFKDKTGMTPQRYRHGELV